MKVKNGHPKKVTVEGVDYSSIGEASLKYGLKSRTVSKRLLAGWSVNEAFGIECRNKNKREEKERLFKTEKKRVCRKCGKLKGVESFPIHKSCVGGRAPVCRRCKTDESRFKRYGVDSKLYDEMLISQGGKCKICGESDPSANGGNGKYGSFCVDHCHKTGVVRGLLCMSCNVGLGKFKDDVDLLKSAIEYLSKK